ncbi:unnamed protein product [Closterium sp. NIES-64]|nr:unnamed protein product [Closterium sp. NIES-64]
MANRVAINGTVIFVYFNAGYNDMLENWAWHVQAVGLGGHFIIFAADQTALAFATSKWPGQAVLLPFSGQFGQEEKISNFESAHFYGDAGFHKVASHRDVETDAGGEGSVGEVRAAEGGGEGAGKSGRRAKGEPDSAGTEREEERQQKRQLQEEQGQKGVGGGSQGNEEEGAQQQQSEQQQEEQKEQEEEQKERGEEEDFDVYLTLDESVLVNASSACEPLSYYPENKIYCSCFLYVRPTPGAKAFIADWAFRMAKTGRSGGIDQDQMQMNWLKGISLLGFGGRFVAAVAEEAVASSISGSTSSPSTPLPPFLSFLLVLCPSVASLPPNLAPFTPQAVASSIPGFSNHLLPFPAQVPSANASRVCSALPALLAAQLMQAEQSTIISDVSTVWLKDPFPFFSPDYNLILPSFRDHLANSPPPLRTH